MENIFLFSVDLEDVRSRIPDGMRYKERVPEMTERYLRFLSEKKSKATFFTVGETAKAYPALIKMIADEGHELACHTFSHIPLTQQNAHNFKDDMLRNMDVLRKSGAKDLTGFRAPTFSMTQETSWAYEVLQELGFNYSSSVLPARNPLYGWENFGDAARKMNQNIWEIPMTLSRLPMLSVPFGGGVYFRVLPAPLVNHEFRKCFSKKKPVLGYFHPYDIDTEQEHFMHPEIGGNKFYNALLYYHRSKVLARLHSICKHCHIMTYQAYTDSILNKKA